MKPCGTEENWQSYLDGELSADARDVAAVHLAECQVCATHVREAEQTMQMIGSAWLSALPDTIPTARLRSRIDAALTEQSAPPFTRAMLWNWKMATVAAALLLTMALLFAWHRLPHETQTIDRTAQNASPQDNPMATAKTAATLPSIKSERRRGLPAPQPQRRTQSRPNAPIVPEVVIATAPNSQDTTDFIPLRYGDDHPPMESGEVIRVEMPRSALIALGLPVNVERADQPVKADLLIGEDGLARAIRFVR